MMKKMHLSFQIGIIFVIAFILAGFLLALNVVSQLDEIYEKNVYDQLESAAKELAASDNSASSNIPSKFVYILYSVKSNIYSVSENSAQLINDEQAALLVNKAVIQPNSISRYKNLINGKQVYYVILNYERSFFGVNSNNIFIVLTDEEMKKNMVTETAVQILVVCFATFLLGYLLIYLWIGKLVRDTRKIAKSLKDTGKNHYKNKVTTTRNDEIGELVASIESMREKIIEGEKHKQEIIQGVSHDLKTPIAIIQSYAEALQDNIYTAEEVSRVTLNQCDRLNKKVKKLLTLTRIEYLDMSDVSFGSTDMAVLIENNAKIYSSKASISIETNIQPALFTGDEDSWQIVLENLLDNAIRYAQTKIILSLDEKEFSVYNDGSKIPEDRIESIFNAYEKGSDGNYGLGLSIVKRTLNLFGYSIKAENTDNGVKFTIS
ncbi:MAG: HAMP domain-containing histidine kinase [Clostridia bacterium]|nr:HAMP domain-containing histidine kinase [Clostridia bacterium]